MPLRTAACAVLIAAVLPGCTAESTPNSSPAPIERTSDPASPPGPEPTQFQGPRRFKPQVLVVTDGRIRNGPALTVTTWGSSSCPFRIEDVTRIGDTLHVFGTERAGLCTADFQRRMATERLPEDMDFGKLDRAVVTRETPFYSVYARFIIGIE